MMMSNNSHIQDMMPRYLNGESTAAENNTLLQWINENEANRDEFELVKRLWSDTIHAALHKTDVESAWQKVSDRTTEKQTKIITSFPWKKITAIAASIILILGIYYFFQQPTQTVWNEKLAQNSNMQIQLSDGTTIILRKGSKLILPEKFEKNLRQVKLEGEAYFEIKHNPEDPFVITTSKSIIEDIGTAFLVQSNDSLDQVTVLQGEVSFANKRKKELVLRLQEGQSAVLQMDKPERKLVKTTNLLSWKTNTLVFNNTPLPQVAKDLENYYLINVNLPDDLRAIQITAQFKGEPIAQVIEELHLFTGLKFQLNGKILTISKS